MRIDRESRLQVISIHFNLHRVRVAKRTFSSLSIMLWRSWDFLSNEKLVKVVGLSRKIRFITIFLLKIVNILLLKPWEESRESFASFLRPSKRRELPTNAAVTIRSSSTAANNQSTCWYVVYSKKTVRAKGFLVLRLKLVL